MLNKIIKIGFLLFLAYVGVAKKQGAVVGMQHCLCAAAYQQQVANIAVGEANAQG